MKCLIPCPHDRVGTPCQLDMFHGGNCSWPTEIDMKGWLPKCRVCGRVANVCPCPALDADGRSTVLPIVHDEARAAPPAVPVTRRGLEPPADVRPWCRRHGWTTECGCEDKPRMTRE